MEAELQLEVEAAETGCNADSMDGISDLDISGDEDFEDIGDIGRCYMRVSCCVLADSC